MKALSKTSRGTVRLGNALSVVLASSLAFVTSTAWTMELETVLEHTTVSPPARVAFREERHNRMLKEALVLTGYLEYLEKGRLRKIVETPFSESFLVAGERIEVSRDGKVHTIALHRSKALRTILVGMEAILAGDVEKLESVFRYTIIGTIKDWSLELTPRSQQVLRHLKAITVVGSDVSITSLRFKLDDGEWHLLEILPNKPQQ